MNNYSFLNKQPQEMHIISFKKCSHRWKYVHICMSICLSLFLALFLSLSPSLCIFVCSSVYLYIDCNDTIAQIDVCNTTTLHRHWYHHGSNESTSRAQRLNSQWDSCCNLAVRKMTHTYNTHKTLSRFANTNVHSLRHLLVVVLNNTHKSWIFVGLGVCLVVLTPLLTLTPGRAGISQKRKPNNKQRVES